MLLIASCSYNKNEYIYLMTRIGKTVNGLQVILIMSLLMILNDNMETLVIRHNTHLDQ